MLIPLGILAASGAGVTSDYELIESVILTSAQSSVTFSNLGNYSSTYQHLQLRMTMRSNHNTSDSFGVMRINGDTGANYFYHELRGNGSSVTSVSSLNETSLFIDTIPSSTSSSNIFSAALVDLLDAYESKNKVIRRLSGSTKDSGGNSIRLGSNARNNTASVTSIDMVCINGSFVSGSRFSLYGVK